MKETPYAWVVVWATFVCLALIFGVSYSFAAFFESFAVEFSAQRADVSWIFGLSGFVYFVMGAGGGMLADRLGPRIVCSAGMALIALGLLATSWATSLLAVYVSYGLLVGLGTRYGSGCTSGHGVCGLSRLSPRSLVATMTFMGAGFAIVYVVRHLF